MPCGSSSARPSTCWSRVIVVIAVFPFYYAIITSLKSGTALFQVDYWPTTFSLNNYVDGLHRGHVPAQPR